MHISSDDLILKKIIICVALVSLMLLFSACSKTTVEVNPATQIIQTTISPSQTNGTAQPATMQPANSQSKTCVRAPIDTSDPCTTYRCMVNGITDGACYATQADCNYACSDTKKCTSDSDCDEGNSNDIHACVGSDSLAKCEYYPKPTCTYVYGTQNDKNVKFAIILQNIDMSDSQKVNAILLNHINKIITTEPFASHKNEMDFYFVNTQVSLGIPNGNPGFDSKKAAEFAQQSCGANQTIVIYDSEKRDVIGGGGGGVAISSAFDPWITLHELGHSFSGLGDNYLTFIPYNGTPIPYWSTYPNTDVAGCSKWCSSYTQAYSNACTKITSQTDCGEKGRTFDSQFNSWECQDPDNCCVWLPQKDPYFNSQCVEVRGHTNIGLDCQDGAGCFFGVPGQYDPNVNQGVWRPFDTQGIMTVSSIDGTQTYNSIESNTIETVFDCCYPQSCSNYPAAKCSQFASTYPRFSTCNSCKD